MAVLISITTWSQEKARWRQKGEQFGSGGSIYSEKSQREIINNNGLHTGQYGNIHNLIGFDVNGCYSGLWSKMPSQRLSNKGYGYGFHFVFEHQRNLFIFQTGIGLEFQHARSAIADTSFFKRNVSDNWSDRVVHEEGAWTGKLDTAHYDLKYDFYGRTDRAWNTYVQIPLYFGRNFIGRSSHFTGYFLTGLKINYCLSGRTSLSATGSTMGFYDRYLGEWREMDNHGLRKDVPIERKGPGLQLRVDVLAHAELGYECGIYSPARGYKTKAVNGGAYDMRFRIGAFADFGILNIMPRSGLDMCYPPDETKWDFSTYRFNHVFSSKDAQNYALHNMFAGVRVTFLWGITTREICRMCRPSLNERDIHAPFRASRHKYHSRRGY